VEGFGYRGPAGAKPPAPSTNTFESQNTPDERISGVGPDASAQQVRRPRAGAFTSHNAQLSQGSATRNLAQRAHQRSASTSPARPQFSAGALCTQAATSAERRPRTYAKPASARNISIHHVGARRRCSTSSRGPAAPRSRPSCTRPGAPCQGRRAKAIIGATVRRHHQPVQTSTQHHLLENRHLPATPIPRGPCANKAVSSQGQHARTSVRAFFPIGGAFRRCPLFQTASATKSPAANTISAPPSRISRDYL